MEVVPMPHVSALSVLAELHQRELLAEAERYRRSRPDPGHRRPWWQRWLRAWQRRGSLRRRVPRRAVISWP